MISKTISCMVRGVQLVFATIIIALDGEIISTSFWNQVPHGPGNPPEINFAMFIGVWTLLCELAFFPIIFWTEDTDMEILLITFGLDALNAIFYMSGGIALAAAMDIHSCADSTYTSDNSITQASSNPEQRCRDAQATTAFIWLNFLVFGVTTVFSIRAVFLYSTGKSLWAKTPTERGSDPEARQTGGPMVAEEMDQRGESARHRLGFGRNRMTDGGPHAAMDQEDPEDNGVYPTNGVSGGPETAEF